MKNPSPALLVTCVSSGIGNCTLHELINAGYRVSGSVRKREDADLLSNELDDAYMPLIFDVPAAAAVAKGAGGLGSRRPI